MTGITLHRKLQIHLLKTSLDSKIAETETSPNASQWALVNNAHVDLAQSATK